MKKALIDPTEASVAATYFQPSYQRLRLWHAGRSINLLCFVAETSESVRRVLAEVGATSTSNFRAKCFSEMWELSDDQLRAVFDGETAKLDQHIADALGCLDGKYSSACGTLQWGDIETGIHRQRLESRLLKESSKRQNRGGQSRG